MKLKNTMIECNVTWQLFLILIDDGFLLVLNIDEHLNVAKRIKSTIIYFDRQLLYESVVVKNPVMKDRSI